ncbi:hypothetical protein ACLOAV_007253 [Pseudogymnoascus australis]
MADAKPQGPFKLVTVNTAPERAKRLIGRVVEDVKAEYTIIYAANAESTSPPPPDLPKPSFPWGDEEAQLLTGKLAIDEVKNMVEKNQPDVLVSTPVLNLLGVNKQFSASMWTPEESDRIQAIARETKPGIKTMALPQGLQVEKGPDAVVEYIKEKWPGLVA